MQDFLVYTALWLLYYLLHSALASLKTKSVFPESFNYRLFYTIVSVLLLAPLVFAHWKLSSWLLFPTGLGTKLVSIGFGYTAFVLFKQSAKAMDIKAFIGLKQEESSLITSGILGRVRHPLYLATFLLLVGFVLYQPSSLNAAILLSTTIYLPMGIMWEEQKLVKQFGDEYREYRKNVPAFFPRLKTRSS